MEIGQAMMTSTVSGKAISWIVNRPMLFELGSERVYVLMLCRSKNGLLVTCGVGRYRELYLHPIQSCLWSCSCGSQSARGRFL